MRTAPSPVAALTAALAAVAAPLAAPALRAAVAQEPPRAPDPDAPPFLEGQERLEVATPPLRLERPGDNWMFLDLARLREQARAAGQDVSGYERLKARLWQGSSRSDIYVHAWPDPVSRAEPLTPEQHGLPLLEGVKQALVGAEVKGAGATRIGAREGWMFEVHGKTRADAPSTAAVVRAVTYRREDNFIITFTLECPAERATALKRDFAKLLRKARV